MTDKARIGGLENALRDFIDAFQHSDMPYEDFVLQSLYRAQAALASTVPGGVGEEIATIQRRHDNVCFSNETNTQAHKDRGKLLEHLSRVSAPLVVSDEAVEAALAAQVNGKKGPCLARGYLPPEDWQIFMRSALLASLPFLKGEKK